MNVTSVAGWNGGYIQDRRSGERTTLANMPSPNLNRHEIDHVFDAALAQGFRTRTMVVTGAVDGTMFPPEFTEIWLWILATTALPLLPIFGDQTCVHLPEVSISSK
jgi:hypothetical protein